LAKIRKSCKIKLSLINEKIKNWNFFIYQLLLEFSYPVSGGCGLKDYLKEEFERLVIL